MMRGHVVAFGIGFLAVVLPGMPVALLTGWLLRDLPHSGDLAAGRARCRQAVLGQLASPSGARFTGDGVLLAPAGAYLYVGSVDSPNALGVMLRTRYECEIARKGDGWSAPRVQRVP